MLLTQPLNNEEAPAAYGDRGFLETAGALLLRPVEAIPAFVVAVQMPGAELLPLQGILLALFRRIAI